MLRPDCLAQSKGCLLFFTPNEITESNLVIPLRIAVTSDIGNDRHDFVKVYQDSQILLVSNF